MPDHAEQIRIDDLTDPRLTAAQVAMREPAEGFIPRSTTGGAVVINVAGVAAFRPVPFVPGYGAAKAAVVQMTKQLGRRIHDRSDLERRRRLFAHRAPPERHENRTKEEEPT